MIADTSFIIDVIHGEPAAVERIGELEEAATAVKLASCTVFELYTGIIRADKPEEEKSKVLETIQSKQTISADAAVMRKAGRIHGELINDGNRINTFDCIIAATAQLQEETILTDDEQHFERIEDLQLETY